MAVLTGHADSVSGRPAIDACVLLAGGLVPSPLVEEARRPVLDLWLTSRQTVFGRWCDVLYDALAHPDQTADDRAIVHVVHSGPPYAPAEPYRDPRFRVETGAEKGSFRGPAGVLRDVTERYEDDAIILVAEAARYMAGSLDQLFSDWRASGADALVACHPNGEPTGIMLFRRGTLELVPSEGFMDIKEQWLPKLLRAGLTVWTSETRDFQPYPLRTREQFLAASRIASGVRVGGRENGMFTESDRVLGPPRLIGPGLDHSRVAASAEVGPGVVLADAIIMPGAVVSEGAVVVRSIVCPGAVVGAGAEVVDQVVPAAA